VKFSNERADAFNIRTEIVKQNDTKLVRKIPSTKAGTVHVANIMQINQSLEKRYENSPFRPAKCVMEGSVACLEYVEGESLQKTLDKDLLYDDIQGWNAKVAAFMAALKEVYDSEPFQSSHGFEFVFGKVDLPVDTVASRDINIDLVFENIIIKERKWAVIDYEWTFDFLIPLHFLFYRILHACFLVTPYKDKLDINEIMESFGISEQERIEYEKMDTHFQTTFIKQDYVPSHEMREKIGKDVVSLDMLLAVHNHVHNCFVQEDAAVDSNARSFLGMMVRRLKMRIKNIN